MDTKNDEQLQILINSFGKGGLQFGCHAPPTSKQSKNKIKKEVVKQLLNNRIAKDKFLVNKKELFYNSELILDLTFGLEEKRYKKNDVDNLIKNTLDCLKGVLFKDDAQIKKVCATKFFLKEGVKEWTGIRVKEHKK
jgi:Holliday junction resolvase RusA-like endonuclease